MAVNVDLVHFTSLIGGGGGALDAVSVSALAAGAIALGKHNDGWKAYQLQNTSGAVESVPGVILPDTPHENKWWKYLPSQSEIAGQVVRPVFSRTATNQVTLTPMAKGAGYHLDGVGWVYFDSALIHTFTSLAASVWSYLYIDFSTITAAGLITAANLVDSATAPGADGYNGNDRCIFGVLTNGSSEIIGFSHDGSRDVHFADSITESTTLPAVNPSFTTYDIDRCPGFSTLAILRMSIEASSPTGARNLNSRPTGSGFDGIAYLVTENDPWQSEVAKVVVSSGQQVDFSISYSEVTGFTLRSAGFCLPGGM